MITKIEIFENYEIHYTDYDHYMDFKIYVIVGYGKSAKTDEFCIPLYGDNLSVKRDDNDTFLEGGIKWDSCSNWDFQTHESLMHCCDGFHYPWDEARGIIEQRDAAIRAQAIDETLERCAVISEKTSLMGPGAVISEAIRALKTGG